LWRTYLCGWITIRRLVAEFDTMAAQCRADHHGVELGDKTAAAIATALGRCC
jgi:hypothetical protein